MNSCLCSWSGGKDSCYALIKAMEEGLQPRVLLNVLNEAGKISRSHGIPRDILEAQGRAAGLSVQLIESSWADYEKRFTDALAELKLRYQLSHAIFGDIDLQAHRDWEEKVCRDAGLTAVLPLWQQDRKQLVFEMLDRKIDCMIVSCNEIMGPAFIGKKLTKELAEELDKRGIDPCGENGEFHTLVLNCELFSAPLAVEVVGMKMNDGYWFSELRLM